MADTQMRKQPSPPIIGTKPARSPAEPGGLPVMLPVNTNVTDDAREYLTTHSLWDDFAHALDAAIDVFSQSAMIHVEISPDHEEISNEATIVFNVVTPLARAEFQQTSDKLMSTLRGQNRLHPHLAFLKEC